MQPMSAHRAHRSFGHRRHRWLLPTVVVAALAAPLSCFTAPETCHDCATIFDAGPGGGSGTGGSAGRGGAGGGGDPDLVLWYKFDESSGAVATDAAALGGTARNATLTNVSSGTATFSTMAKVGTHALALNGSSSTVGAYASLPGLQA